MPDPGGGFGGLSLHNTEGGVEVRKDGFVILLSDLSANAIEAGDFLFT